MNTPNSFTPNAFSHGAFGGLGKRSAFGSAPSSGTPANPVTVGRALQLMGYDIVGVDGAAISTWPDSGGGGNDATQSTGGLRPTLKTGVLNGRKVVRFDGADDTMATPSIATSSGALTLFAVCNRTWADHSDYRSFFSKGTYGAGSGITIYLPTQDAAIDWQGGDLLAFGGGYNPPPRAVGPSSWLTGWQTVTIVLSATQAHAWANGSLISSRVESAGAIPADTSPVLLGQPAAPAVWDSDIAALIVYDAELSSGEIAAVEAWLRTLYAHY